jgi:hypothetical protein
MRAADVHLTIFRREYKRSLFWFGFPQIDLAFGKPTRKKSKMVNRIIGQTTWC